MIARAEIITLVQHSMGVRIVMDLARYGVIRLRLWWGSRDSRFREVGRNLVNGKAEISL
jgi:hypothetical protein